MINMECRKCKKELPEGALYCCWCGISQTPIPKTAKKRGNGQGSVYKLPNGKWRATITVGYGADKKRKTISRQFERKTDAVLALGEMRNLAHSNVLYDITFEECMNRSLEIKKDSVSHASLAVYNSAKKHFDIISKMKINEVKAEHLQQCFDKVEAYKTKNVMRAVSHSAFQYAMQNDIVNKDYTDFVNLGKNDSERHEPFTMEEIVKFKTAADNGDYTAKIMMCLICTGMRPSEMFQMKKKDYYDGCLHGGVKTKAGKDRVIPVNGIIKPYIEQQMQNPSELLFPSLRYKQINPNNFRTMMYGPLLDKLEIDNSKTPYSARHSFASLLNKLEDTEANRDIVSRQTLMGHSDIEMTKHYTHADIEQLTKLTDGVSNLICNAVCSSADR